MIHAHSSTLPGLPRCSGAGDVLRLPRDPEKVPGRPEACVFGGRDAPTFPLFGLPQELGCDSRPPKHTPRSLTMQRCWECAHITKGPREALGAARNMRFWGA